MDENFLLHRQRALRILDLMAEHDKSWALYIFSSAKVLRSYTPEQLIGLGISWVWMGLEGDDTQYAKVKGVDTHDLVRNLQSHGICVLGSTIIGLEEHTCDNIDAAIEYAVSHDTEFHQFMLYTPVPGTPLHAEHQAKGTLLDDNECPIADAHGQFKFNFRHPFIKNGQETDFLLRAFRRDFSVNGPSIVRMARTILQGWRRYKNHPDRRIRRRFAWDARELPVTFAGALWAAKQRFRGNPELAAKISRVLKEIHGEFGIKSRLIAPLVGRYLKIKLSREDKRLRKGWTYEPPTFYDTKPVT
jgi:hypothetical protein